MLDLHVSHACNPCTLVGQESFELWPAWATEEERGEEGQYCPLTLILFGTGSFHL